MSMYGGFSSLILEDCGKSPIPLSSGMVPTVERPSTDFADALGGDSTLRKVLRRTGLRVR